MLYFRQHWVVGSLPLALMGWNAFGLYWMSRLREGDGQMADIGGVVGQRMRTPLGGWVTYVRNEATGSRYVVSTVVNALGVWEIVAYDAAPDAWIARDLFAPLVVENASGETETLRIHDELAKRMGRTGDGEGRLEPLPYPGNGG